MPNLGASNRLHKYSAIGIEEGWRTDLKVVKLIETTLFSRGFGEAKQEILANSSGLGFRYDLLVSDGDGLC